MTTYDHRSNPSAEYAISFLVLDHMGTLRDGQGGDIYRYDTAQEAAEMFRHIRDVHPEWRPSLGAYSFDMMVGPHGIDLVHTDNGTPFLVADYRMDDRWGSGREIERAVKEVADNLGLEWQMDWNLLGVPVMVPYALQEHPESLELVDITLRPFDPERPLSSVSSALVEGQGWVSPGELRALSSRYEAGASACPKVISLTVSCEDVVTGRMGNLLISPLDFKTMERRFQELQQQRESEREAQAAAQERASWPNGEPPLPDTGMPFFDYPDGHGGFDKVNMAVGTHGSTNNLYVAFDVFDRETGEMREGPDLTANILKLPPFVAAIDAECNCDGVVDFLTHNGFGQLTGDVLQCESRLYPLFRFDENRLEGACKEGVEFYRDRSGLNERRKEVEWEGVEPLGSLVNHARDRVQERNSARSSKPAKSGYQQEI